MPLTDIDVNTAGHESKASNVSTGQHSRHGSQSTSADGFRNSPAVMSMLRTTTDLGDLDIAALKPARLRPSQRPGGSRALSRTSSHYSQYSRAESIRSHASNHSAKEPSMPGGWPTPGLQQPGYDNQSRSTSMSDRTGHNRRSYSLTTTNHPARLLGKNNRSATSLQSSGPSINRPRSPYQYPARLRRPGQAGLRPGSPAYSDTYGTPYNRSNLSRPGPGQRAATGFPFPAQGQHDMGGGYAPHALPRQPLGQDQRLQRPPFTMHPSLEGLRQAGPTFARNGTPFRTGPSPLRNDQNYSRFATNAPLTPHTGFVQRVKNLLEERASMEESPKALKSVMSQENIGFKAAPIQHVEVADFAGSVADEPFDFEDHPQIDNADLAELPALSPSVRRLTRDLVKTALSPPSDAEHVSSPNLLDSSVFVSQPDEPEPDSSSLPGAESDVETAASSTDSVDEAEKKDTHEMKMADVKEVEDEHILRAEGDDHDLPIPAAVSEAGEDIESHSDDDDQPAELPAEKSEATTLHSFSDDPEHVKGLDRPFSMPQASEDKTETSNTVRQSMPAVHIAGSDTANVGNAKDTAPAEAASTLIARESGILEKEAPAQPLQADTLDIRLSMLGRPASAADTRHSWARSIASRVLSEPGSTIAEEGGRDSWAMATASRVVSFADDKTLVGSRPASAGDVPLSWNRSSAALRFSSLPPLVESQHSSTTLTEDPVAPSDFTPHPAVAAMRRSSIRDSGMATIPVVPDFGAQASSTAENRFSAMKHFQTGLSDLTEDSQEDASTTNLRMLGPKPPPFRNSRQRGDPRPGSRAHGAGPSQPRTYFSRKLSDTKAIPSFEFSSTDLAKSLNLALGLRESRSLESLHDKRRQRPKGIVMPSPRSRASSRRRDRYRSYFSETNSSEDEAQVDAEETEKALQQQEELINEIEKISIPSVTHLSQRLSELFPTLKKSTSDPELTTTSAALDSVIEEIRDIGSEGEGSGSRRDSVISARPELTEKRSSSADTYTTITKARLDKELPPLPSDVMSPRPSAASGPARVSPDDDTVELEGEVPSSPPPARKPSSREKNQAGPSNALKSSASKQLLRLNIPSTPAGEPSWKKSSSFPWTTATPGKHLQDTGSDEGDDEASSDTASKLRSKVSKQTSILSQEQGTRIARTMSTGLPGDANLIPSSDRTSADIDDPVLKKGLIGSITRKMGKRPRNDNAPFPLDPEFLHPHERLSGTISKGDKYPTTSLTPPAGLGIDDTARSFFSDSSSEHEERQVGSIRKRFTRLGKSKAHSRTMSAGDATPSHAITSPLRDDSIFGGSHPALDDADVVFMMHEEPAVGMSKTEFRAKKFVEKIRRLWFRLSTKKHPHNWREETDLYEVV